MTAHRPTRTPVRSKRSRFRLDPAAKRDYPLHLIDQGLPILESIRLLRFATHAQLTRLHFANHLNQSGENRTYLGADRGARTSLQRLWQAGFITRHQVMLSSRRSSFGYQHFVNVLTNKGSAAITGTERARYRVPSISNQTIDHSLAINDAYVLIRRAAELYGIGVHDWLDDRKLTAMQAQGSLKLVSIPDAFFVLSYQGRYYGHFLEIDTGSVSVETRRRNRSWTETISDYGEYFREWYPKDGFFKGFTAPIVLTITSGPTRREHLLAATKKAGGVGVYWYSTMEELNPVSFDPMTGKPEGFDPSIWWEPKWKVVNDTQPRSLFDRLVSKPQFS